MKLKLAFAISLAVLGSVPFSSPSSAQATFSAADFCNSARLKAIVEAIKCKRDNCGGDYTDYIYACTQVEDAARFGADTVRIDVNQDTRAGAFTRVNDNYPVLEALNSMRVDPPPKYTEIPPCECLALIEAKTKCGIEQCPAEKPAEVPAEPPAEAPAPPKAQVPDQAPAGNSQQVALSGGSLCALGFGDFSNQSMAWAGWGILGGLSLLGLRHRLARQKY